MFTRGNSVFSLSLSLKAKLDLGARKIFCISWFARLVF
jgi:hypothetical protein